MLTDRNFGKIPTKAAARARCQASGFPVGTSGFVVGVDVGGTSTQALVYDAALVPAGSVTQPTVPGEEGVLRGTADAIHRVLVDSGVARDRVVAIGIGIPGAVDRAAGNVTLAVNLDIGAEPVELGPFLAAGFDLPVLVENDVACAAIGAHAHLRRQGMAVQDLAYIGIGTGLAAGIVLDGHLHTGHLRMAGEIGHVVVAPGEGRCACGLDGCLEVVASGGAIARRWPSADGEPAAEALFAAASRHEPRAMEIADEVVGYLTTAVQWLLMSLAPDVVVLGGGVGANEGPVPRRIRERLAEQADRSLLARRLCGPERVLSLPSELALGALGAAVLAAENAVHDGASRRGGDATTEAARRRHAGVGPSSVHSSLPPPADARR
jgi:glucokinase